MLKIFNTLTCKKEIFKPIINNKINVYVCGVTVYDLCHIGHGRTFVVFDMIVRYLRDSGFQVTYIRNITDVDDKIILKSIKNKMSIKHFTDNMIKEMNKDFSSLGLLVPNQEPRVTKHIHEIITCITELINKKHAYINQIGDVVFSIKSSKKYGTLSRQSLNFLKSGSRVPFNYMKKNPLDFILWKKSIEEEYSWDSPWGKGRPGWHIECSAITNHYFQNHIDIHGGGSDLLFPHHENEYSQSICLNNSCIINYWMHAGMVIIKNQKMSKSLGNAHYLRNILSNYDAETLRYFFLLTHYRHPIHFCENNLNKANASLKHLYVSLNDVDPIYNQTEGMNFETEFFNAMNDDFNTPKAFSVLFLLSRKINSIKHQDNLKASRLAFRLRFLAGKLGFLLKNPQDFLKNKSNLNPNIIKKIEFLIEKRNIARKYKLWKEADSLRKNLKDLDIILEDLPEKTIWRKK
ncbi:cysteine--tRNA ligase [Buchnera aphidicola (Muscaphis stroyani)]|uniref:Cysteine--tRNA ligase n=1 Tax=Buchnera aphidicola (Muscaphis stroyani) TaxID=1241869 RepID=A0A4D6Y527_9GAMM|nr:cysteine--tRNA ligase [Buchnera aphidicola]QCI24522.1 cysteine--tRNA ligase [Buchnera aphidicola (Muscaphis stroyani)]